MQELKPCPLCGSTDLKHYVTNARERNRGVIVCKGCGLRLEEYSDDEYKLAQAYMGDFESAHKFTWEQARDAVADKWNRLADLIDPDESGQNQDMNPDTVQKESPTVQKAPECDRDALLELADEI